MVASNRHGVGAERSPRSIHIFDVKIGLIDPADFFVVLRVLSFLQDVVEKRFLDDDDHAGQPFDHQKQNDGHRDIGEYGYRNSLNGLHLLLAIVTPDPLIPEQNALNRKMRAPRIVKEFFSRASVLHPLLNGTFSDEEAMSRE